MLTKNNRKNNTREKKFSNLSPVLSTANGHVLFEDNKGNFFATSKEDVKVAFVHDLFFGTSMDALEALNVLVDIATSGGWAEVKQI